MPIRWGEFYATGSATPLRVLCNRGANGIDGIVSTAAGVAAGLKRPVVLVVGDIALIHDLNGLAAVRQYEISLKIVLLNNDGGGIFSFLPIAAHQDVCDSLVAMPHGREFGHAAAFWGIRHQRLESIEAFDSAFSASLMTEGPEILEVKSTRHGDLAASREINRLLADKFMDVSRW
jgi:2-succinyl-5-enolpyruvyl-6-hydroxy-3-cyclohexene-1-carboxylate synthase